jgi:hypothetical protein
MVLGKDPMGKANEENRIVMGESKRDPLEVMKLRQKMLVQKWITMSSVTKDPKERRIWLRCAEDLQGLLKK